MTKKGGNNMACFLVPAAEAIVATVVEKAVEKKEENQEKEESTIQSKEQVAKVPFSRKLKWLTYLLWGGALLLAFEHVWHGEVVPWFPFLTAMDNPGDMAEMFGEMATVGVTMAVLVTVVWIAMCFISDAIVKRTSNSMSRSTNV